MTTTGFEIFDKSIQKTNRLLGKLEKKFGWEERREQSYSIVREVLHALRDRIPVNDAANFSAQLNLLLKGIFFDGWNPSETPMEMDKDQFIQRIRENFPYSLDEDIENVIKGTINAIMDTMGGKIERNVKNTLPTEISKLIN